MGKEEGSTVYHTYEFLKKRKNDPKWRDQYLEKKEDRTIAFLYKIIFLLVGLNLVVWSLAII